MTEPKLPSGPSPPPPSGAPRWQRRLDAKLGVIDAAAAQRLYDRTGGWAMERAARASELAARYASADHSGASVPLPLARVPTMASEQSDAEDAAARGVADAGKEPERHASGSIASATTIAAPSPISGLAMRLQRRITDSGMIGASPANRSGREVAAVSLRTGLYERVAARSDATVPAMTALARVDAQRRDGGNGRGRSAAVRTAQPAGDLARSSAGAASDATPMAFGGPAPIRAAASSIPAGADATHDGSPSLAVDAATNPAASVRDVASSTVTVVRPNASRPSEETVPLSLVGTPKAVQTRNGSVIARAPTDHSPAPEASERPAVPTVQRAPAARISEPAAANSSRDRAGSSLSLVRPSVGGSSAASLSTGRGVPSMQARKISGPQTSAAPRAREASAPVSAQHGIKPLVSPTGSSAGDAQSSSPLWRSGANPAAALAQPKNDPGVPAAAAGRQARSTTTSALTAAPLALSVAHDESSGPLTLARTRDVGDAYDAQSAHHSAPAQPEGTTAVVEQAMGRSAETSIAAHHGPGGPLTLARMRDVGDAHDAQSAHGSPPAQPEVTTAFVEQAMGRSAEISIAAHHGPGEPLTLARTRDVGDAHEAQSEHGSVPAQAEGATAFVEQAMGRSAEISIAAHHGPGEPLTLARMPDFNDARDRQPTHDSASTQAARVPPLAQRAERRAAEISIAAPVIPRLVWRNTDDPETRKRPARFVDSGGNGLLMRTDADGAVPAPSVPTPALPPGQGHAMPAASAPALDLGRLAEQVTRLIVRRLDVECERRGVKRWI